MARRRIQLLQATKPADKVRMPQEDISVEEPLGKSHIDIELDLIEILEQRFSVLSAMTEDVWT